MPAIALVAREKLVAAVAAEHDLHVVDGRAREIPHRKRARIRERLVEIGDDALEIARDRLRHRHRVIRQPDRVGERIRVGRLVHLAAGKGGGEGMQVAEALRRQAAGEHARVDAAREEDPERPVGDGADLHRVIERRAPIARLRAAGRQ